MINYLLITIIQAVVFLSYVNFLLLYFGKPLSSISESWYQLPEKLKILFTFFCWIIGFLMLFQTNGNSALFFISGSGLCFVGVATMFKSNDITPIIHFTGAAVCILGALAGIGLERGSFLPLTIWIVVSALLALLKVKNSVWWIEMAAFAAIISGLFLC